MLLHVFVFYGSRNVPPVDPVGIEGTSEFDNVTMFMDGEWTSVTFDRLLSGDDDSVSDGQ